MRAKELIPILAEIWSVDFIVADQIDRALSNGGFRQKAKGRAWPDMTRREALHFLIGCMTARVPSRAADDVAVWTNADWSFKPDFAYFFPEYDEYQASDEIEDDPLDEDDLEDDQVEPLQKVPMGYVAYIGKPVMEAEKNGAKITLTDYLILLIRFLSDGHADAEEIKFVIDHHHGEAKVQFTHQQSRVMHEDVFLTNGTARVWTGIDDVTTMIYRPVHVFGEALLAIAARTEPEVNEKWGLL